MEVIATADETQSLRDAHPSEPFLLFPEDRRHPIRMTKDLPERWIKNGPRATFTASTRRGEFLSFQVGVWALRAPLSEIAVRFNALHSASGYVLPATAFRCFNQGGIDWLGRRFSKQISVARGQVGPLWMGVQIPKTLKPGTYRGSLAIAAKGFVPQKIRLALDVRPETAKDAGDDDPWNMSRLRWLDSTIGLDDEVVKPYTALKLRGSTIECLGRQVRFGPDGLPTSIKSGGNEILARPIALVVETGGHPLTWKSSATQTLTRAPGAVTRQTKNTAGPVCATCLTKMEADGYANYRIAVSTKTRIRLSDIRLEIPVRSRIATYLMGMGREGGYRPASWSWNWTSGNANNMVWIGDVQAGIQCKLKGPTETWDLFHLASIPDAWSNGGKGGCTISEQGSRAVLLNAFSGPRELAPGQILHFNFGLLITPVKPLDPAHWSWRYDHEYVSPDQAKANGATIINIHQGNELNPYINYPFVTADKLAAYVKKAHAENLKVKIYYTVRELSNRVAEMWPLRCLGYEVFTDGLGGGDSWLQEHLVDHYKPAWHTPLLDGSIDAAIATAGLSRWHNYYLEGLRWLIANVGIDGLYLDGIGYDREIMKRVRKVMDRTRPGCLIDFHCGNSYQPQYGMNSPANQFMEHFPYISSLWLGEGFDYNETPDYWLVEISGIPFGLYGEMLQDNGNPWRGMVYGMTARYYSGADPKHIWKLWDDFGIAGAKMLGYWSPSCPVRTSDPDVLATAYVRNGRTLISLASWAKKPVLCRLKIDWKALGLDSDHVQIVAPAVKGFQSETSFQPSDSIPVEPGRGWMLIVSQR
jgi:hypothetical protein